MSSQTDKNFRRLVLGVFEDHDPISTHRLHQWIKSQIKINLGLSDEHAIDDIASESMLKFVVNFNKLVEAEHCQAYAATIIRNALADYWRKKKGIQATEPLPPDFEAMAEVNSINPLMGARVVSALRKLPANDRKMLEMKYFDNWSAKKIAKELGVSTVTVYKRIKKAHIRFFDEFGGDFD